MTTVQTMKTPRKEKAIRITCNRRSQRGRAADATKT